MMINKILKFFLKPTITYGITVCNEAEEISTLLATLLPLIDVDDEVIVLQDTTTRSQEVDRVLQKYSKNIVCIESQLNSDFATFKNNLIEKSTKKYLFQIDADEIPTKALIKNLKKHLKSNFKNDVFFVPRINTVAGITEEDISKWKWAINEDGYINFPDYQQRILKLNNKIYWKNKVHEVLAGFENPNFLPKDNYDYCLIHKKTIQKQTAQNNLYDRIVGA